jgi:hypothetical protein
MNREAATQAPEALNRRAAVSPEQREAEQHAADHAAIMRGLAGLKPVGPRPSRKTIRRRRTVLVRFTERLRNASPDEAAKLRQVVQAQIDRARDASLVAALTDVLSNT